MRRQLERLDCRNGEVTVTNGLEQVHHRCPSHRPVGSSCVEPSLVTGSRITRAGLSPLVAAGCCRRLDLPGKRFSRGRSRWFSVFRYGEFTASTGTAAGEVTWEHHFDIRAAVALRLMMMVWRRGFGDCQNTALEAPGAPYCNDAGLPRKAFRPSVAAATVIPTRYA
jgi:hypothetical protein